MGSRPELARPGPAAPFSVATTKSWKDGDRYGRGRIPSAPTVDKEITSIEHPKQQHSANAPRISPPMFRCLKISMLLIPLLLQIKETGISNIRPESYELFKYRNTNVTQQHYLNIILWCLGVSYVFLNSINLYSVLLGRIVCTHSIRCDLLAGYCYRRSSVVCLCMCLLVTFVSPVKTAEPIEMLFGWLTRVGPRTTIRYDTVN